MTSNQFKISDLIYRRHFGQLSEEENCELENWIKSSPEHQKYYEKLFTDYSLQQIDTLSKIDVYSAWKKYNARYPQKRKLLPILKYASVVAVAIITIGLWFYFDNTKIDKQNIVAEKITPQSTEPILIIDKEKISLGKEKTININLNDGAQLASSSSNIIYNSSKNSEKRTPPEQHTLIVPRGGNFFITFSDGTKAWINSETTIKYPSHFASDSRIVELEGEAYFDVVENSSSPFIVYANGVKVQVLGTQFNVNSYKKSGVVLTTLVEGQVKVSSEGNADEVLMPRMQSYYNTKTSEMQIFSDVKTQLYTAWKDGVFMYENTRLEDIMTQIARKYNIDIVYEDDKCRDLRFTGEFEQFEDFKHIANILNLTIHVSIRFEKNVAYIR